MGGNVSLQTKTILPVIIDNLENNVEVKSVVRTLIKATDFITFIWKNSIIDYKEYYKTCVRISMNTSNTQHDCDKMEFYVFNNYMTFFTELKEEEKTGKTTEGEQPGMQDANSMFAKSMASTKNMLNSGQNKFKAPR